MCALSLFWFDDDVLDNEDDSTIHGAVLLLTCASCSGALWSIFQLSEGMNLSNLSPTPTIEQEFARIFSARASLMSDNAMLTGMVMKPYR